MTTPKRSNCTRWLCPVLGAALLLVPRAAGAAPSGEAPAPTSSAVGGWSIVVRASGLLFDREREARVDALFREWDRPDSPGCAVGVIRDGSLEYARGYGIANLDYGLPITPESVFYLASVTKQFTAGVVARLALEGEVDLDAPVGRYLPELPDYGEGEPIVVRHLAQNVSGIRDYLDLMRISGLRFEDVHTREGILGLITSQEELNFPPGSRYLYSNSNFFLLALLVERATGLTLREYGERHLFRPLGMEATHFHDDRAEIVRNRVTSYHPSEEGAFHVSYMANTDWTGVGAGNLHSSIEDLARWEAHLQRLEAGGDPWVALTQTPGVVTGGDTIDYAFGLRVGSHKGLRTVSHGGGWMGFGNHYLRFPDARFAALVLCNAGTADAGTLAREVAEIYLEDEFATGLGELEGVYRSSEATGAEYRVSVEAGDLVLHRLRERDRVVLEPTGDADHYRGTWNYGAQTRSMEVRFQREGVEGGADAGKRRISALRVDTGRAWGVRFDPVEPGSDRRGIGVSRR
jgi:CubicO group peptidase (beta-lactamase class C family)